MTTAIYGNSKRLLCLITQLMVLACVAGCTPLKTLLPDTQGQRMPGRRTDAISPKTRGQSINNTKRIRLVSIPGPQNVTWTQSEGAPNNRPGNAKLDSETCRLRWKVATATNNKSWISTKGVPVFHRPVAANGRVFVYNPNGQVSAHSLTDGRLLWKKNVRQKGYSNLATGGGLAVYGGTVYVATGFRTVFALNAGRGNLIWSKKLLIPTHSSPAVDESRIYFVTQDNTVIALNRSNGAEAWSFKGIPDEASVMGAVSPAISGDTLVAPFSSGELVALNKETGSLHWSSMLANATSFTAISGLADISASPVVHNSVIYATGVMDRTIALSLDTGQKIWERTDGASYAPAVAENTLFLIGLNNVLYAIALDTGETIWQRKLISRLGSAPVTWAGPILANGKLWLTSSLGRMLAVDAVSGKILLVVRVGSSTIAPIVASRKIVTLDNKGVLMAID